MQEKLINIQKSVIIVTVVKMYKCEGCNQSCHVY